MADILVYATSAEMTTWTGAAAPSNATVLLRTASLTVRNATRAASYDVNETTGAPTDTDVAAAMRDATCAQAAALDANGVNPLAGTAGIDGAVSATAIGSASVQYAVAPDAARHRQALLDTLTSEAAMILRDAGLLGQPLIEAWG